MPSSSTSVVLGAAAAFLVGACADSSSQANPSDAQSPPSGPAQVVAEVSDSAGVTLRRSPAEALERTAYEISIQPSVLIDGTEGGGEPLHAVGATAFGPGGTIAIAERGEMGVRIHDADGGRIRVIGRDGQGPGEFGALNGLGFHADSMFVFDSRWFRISVFGPDGEYVRQIVPESSFGDRPRWFAFARDGAILTTSRGSGGSIVWGLHALDGTPIQSFPDAPSPPVPTMAMLSPVGGDAAPAEPLELFRPVPLAGTRGEHVVVSSGASYRLQLHDAAGTLSEVWSVAGAHPRVVTDADVEAARQRARENTDPELHAVLDRRWSRVDPAERFPAFGANIGMIFTAPPQIIEAAQGELWVRGFPADPGQGPLWWAFGADGTLMGSVTLPERFELHAVSEAGALGIHEDIFDVQRVALYPLTRPGG